MRRNCEQIFHSLESTQVMGIINVTTDSFFADSRMRSISDVVDRTREMITEGASIIDIGAYSTRPGATEVSEEDEVDRIREAVRAVRETSEDVVISVDTFRSSVAKVAMESGADIINDVSGGRFDADLIPYVALSGAPYILMHSEGESVSNQQTRVYYGNFMDDICRFFAEKLRELHCLGIKDIILDPGYGFSKSMEENYELLARLHELNTFGCPILVGVSRKRMAWQVAETSIEDSLIATTALHTLALSQGLPLILRVHDVKAAVQTTRICSKYCSVIRK